MNNITTQELLEKATPLIKLLNELHPHHTIIVTSTSAVLYEWEVACYTEEFVKD